MADATWEALNSCISETDKAPSGQQNAIGPGVPSDQLEVNTSADQHTLTWKLGVGLQYVCSTGLYICTVQYVFLETTTTAKILSSFFCIL